MDAGVDTNHSDTNVADRPADVSPAVDGGTVLPAAPKLAADIAPFIKTKCAASGCHDPIKKEHGMDMSTGPTIYAAWVNKMTADHCANDAPVTRVIPSRPADSFVLKMVENVGRCAEMPRMPPAPRAALTAAEIKAVRDWITAGAMND